MVEIRAIKIMKKFICSSILISCCIAVQSQFVYNKTISYDLGSDIGMMLSLDKNDSSAIIIDDRILTYHLTDTTLKVKFENQNGYFVEGQYIVTSDTFQKVVSSMDADSGEFYLAVSPYKYPLKNGIWYFRDGTGQLHYQEKWVLGIRKE